MNKPIEIVKDIYFVGTNDRETALFEAIWPLPRGVSYNSYLIDDEKVALVDGVKAGQATASLDRIRHAIGDKKVDYLIVNHMEPDHSGDIAVLRNVWPEMKIVGNAKTTEFLSEFYGLTENLHVVADGDVLDLGTHKLQFHLTPMVHWPETMMTLDTATGVLFSGDAFGGFGALEGGIFDDEVDVAYYESEVLRYFSNIVGKYSTMVQRAITKLADAEINVVASTHGVVWRHRPRTIIELYDKWSRQETEPGVVIAFGSMYGNTAKMAESIGLELARQKVDNVRVHNLSRSHPSFVLVDVWRYNGLLIGTPTYNMGVFPLVESFVNMLANKKLKHRHLGLFGTYGWSGGGVKGLRQFADSQSGWGLIEPVVEARCSANDEDYGLCRQLGRAMVQAIRKG